MPNNSVKSNTSFGMTVEQYAEYRGVEVSDVRRALESGQLTRVLDGSIDPAHPPIGLTPPQYAELRSKRGLRGGTRQMVHKALASGWLVTYVDGTIDADASDVSWEQCANSHPDNGNGSAGGAQQELVDSDLPIYAVERAKREAAVAEKARMEADLMAGRIIEKSKVERQWVNIMQVMRQRILGLPDRLAGTLAGLTDQSEIHRRLDDECRQALNEAASDVEALTGADDE